MATKSTRAPVKAVAKSSTEIAANAAAEKARKLASKAALKAVLPSKAVKAPRKPKAGAAAPQVITTDALEAKRAQEAQNVLKSQREDYNALLLADALTTQGGFEGYLAEQGFNVDGTPKAASAVVKPGSYQGPMLALRAASQHYVKGANGNPHCNDWLAASLAGLTRDQVVTCLIAAMKLPGNPYLLLNPGQQSMNLRNKARGMAKAGTLTQADLDAAIEHASRHPA